MADDELQVLENLVLSQNPDLINNLPTLSPLKPYLSGLSLLNSDPTSSKFTKLLKSLETNTELHDRLQLRQWIKAYEKTNDPEILHKINALYFNYTFDYPPPKNSDLKEISHLSSIFVPHFPDLLKAESDLDTYQSLEENQSYQVNLENSSDDVFACALDNNELWKYRGVSKRFAENYKKGEIISECDCFRAMSLEQIEEIGEFLPKIWKNEGFVWYWLNKKYFFSLENMNDSQKYEFIKMVATEIITRRNFINHFKFLILAYLLSIEKSLGKCEEAWFLRFLSYYQGQFSSKSSKNSKLIADNDFYKLFEEKYIDIDYDLIIKYYLSTLFFSNPDFFTKAKKTLNRKFLKELLFESLILRGEPLESIPKKYLRIDLIESIELEPCADNPRNFTRSEAVRFSMNLKNIQKLYLKVIELNPRNYYLKTFESISEEIELDGLTAQTEYIFEYSDPSHKRLRTEFYFPELTKKVGVFVIEFFGGGRHSRVIIKKGSLRYLSKATANGHELYILNEDNELCTKGAGVYLDLRFYQADEKTGRINLPFARENSKKKIIFTDGYVNELACEFYHLRETYNLDAKFIVNEQQMIAGSSICVLMRLYLTLNGVDIPLSFLDEVSVAIKAQNTKGTISSKIIKNPTIPRAGAHFELPFEVPYNLTKVKFEVYCTGKYSDGEELMLNVSDEISVNQSLESLQIINILLVKRSEDFILQVKGRNGEAIVRQRIDIEAKHLLWIEKFKKALVTDELGQIFLGNLQNIYKIRAFIIKDNENSLFYKWNISKLGAYIEYPKSISICSADEFALPIILESDNQNVEDLLWFILKNDDGEAVQNKISSVKLDKNKSLLRFNKLEVGEYLIEFKDNQNLTIYVYDGIHFQENWIITDTEIHLITTNNTTIGISDAKLEESNNIKVELSGSLDMNPGALAIYFNYLTNEIFSIPKSLTQEEICNQIYRFKFPECFNVYVESKKLDEESLYVFNRKKMPRIIGSPLPKPQIMLKRKSVLCIDDEVRKEKRKSALSKESSKSFDSGSVKRRTARKAPGGCMHRPDIQGYLTSYDFLTIPAASLQLPITGSQLIFPKLENYTNVLIIVYNNHNYSYKLLQLDSQIPQKDIRFKSSVIDSIETYKSAVLKPGETFILNNYSAASIKIIDSLPKLFDLILQVSNLENTSKDLREWSFLSEWSTLNFDEKKKMYDIYASHELNFYIFKRDFEFFSNIVKPFLLCKTNKDIPDKYLCGISITEYADFKFSSSLNSFEMALVVDQLKESNSEIAQRMNRILYDIADGGKVEASEKVKRIKAALQFDSFCSEKVNNYSSSESDEERSDEEPEKRVHLRAKRAEKKSDDTSESSGNEDNEEDEAEEKEEEEKIGMGSEEEREVNRDTKSEEKDDTSENEENFSSPKLPRYYKKIGDTKQFCESYYYNYSEHPNALLFAELSTSFLLNQPWISESVLYSVSSLTEQILLLSYASLPDSPQIIVPSLNENTYELTSSTHMLLFYKELASAPQHFNPSISLYFKYNEATDSQESTRKVKQFVKETVYECLMIINNSSDRDLHLSVFSQIPEGSIACQPYQTSKTEFIKLKSCATESIKFTFYFPASGNYLHYAGNVAENEVIIANSELSTIEVLDRYDSDGFSCFKDFATAKRKDLILEFFSTQNLLSQDCEYDINHIGWMLLDKEFWMQAINILRQRFLYEEVVWKFGFFHYHIETISEILNTSNKIRKVVGNYFTSDIITASVVNLAYSEFDPVITSRVYQIGNQKRIANTKLRAAWRKLLVLLAEKGSLDNKDRIYLCQYLIYQDRYSEAIDLYKQIDLKPSEGKIEPNEIQIQFDYLTCFLNPKNSATVAELYKNYPVLTWNSYFKAVIELVNDYEPTVFAANAAAYNEPTLNFEIIENCIEIVYENLKKCLIRIYEIDLEVLFSKNPFLIQGTQRFSYVKASTEIKVILKENPQRVSLADHKCKNLWIEIDYKTYNVSKSHLSNLLLVNCMERFGIIKVMGTNRIPRPAAYVKTYAKLTNGKIEFYKDGYTDIQGKFDYVSLNIDKLNAIEKFAILIVDDELGSSVQEVLPPPQ